MENSAPERPVLDCDRAAWVKARLVTLVDIALTLQHNRRGAVQAEEEMFQLALAGAIRGAAREIVRTLGFEPGENLEAGDRPLSL